MIYRHITENILQAIADTPVLLLSGARQTGKSTLIQWIIEKKYPATYITMDDSNYLSAAINDPAGFIASFTDNVVIDEIQRAPELFIAIKSIVDKDRKPGKFILTGSANVMLLPKLYETLAGRIEILNLYPFSEAEICENPKCYAKDVFSANPMDWRSKDALTQEKLLNRVVRGGYPEILKRKTHERQKAWFKSYITTILQKDIRDLSNINRINEVPLLLSLIASRTSGLFNLSEFSRVLGIPQTTLKRYLSLLEVTFLINYLPAYSGNLGKRITKSPKIFFSDTGLACYLIGFNMENVKDYQGFWGAILENFVVMELTKQLSAKNEMIRLFHFRSQSGMEVDIVLENEKGEIAGIEVKASSTVKTDDFKGLKYLSQNIKQFKKGIVLYTGKSVVPFGNNLFAMPIETLWN